MKPVTTIVAVLLVAISIGHLLRVIFRVEVIADGVTIPVWVSVIGCVVPVLLAFLLWRENRKVNYLKRLPLRKK